MRDDLACSRFRRVLSELPAGHVLRLTDIAAPAMAAGVSLVQATMLLDADAGWQRLFLDEYGFVVAARCAHDECVSADTCEVAWRRLTGKMDRRRAGHANRLAGGWRERRQTPRDTALS